MPAMPQIPGSQAFRLTGHCFNILSDISQITFKSTPIIPNVHYLWNNFPSAAIRQSNFGDLDVFGSPFGQFCRHPDAPPVVSTLP